MKILIYTLEELPDLVEATWFKTSAVLPISRHRALSHFHNPRAKKEDQVLWLLFEEEQLVAYRLVLPDVIYLQDEPIRIAWVSCIYVHSDWRGKGYAQTLTRLAAEAWKGQLMGTEFAPSAHTMHQKGGVFSDFSTSEGIRLYFKLQLSKLLPQRVSFFRFFRLGLILLDGIINSFQWARLKLYSFKLPSSLSYKKLDRINDTTWNFIVPFQKNEFTRRSQKELNWLLQYPWIIETKHPSDEAQRYHFSAEARQFKQKVISIDWKNQLIGVLIISIRDGHLKIPYAYFHKSNTAQIAQVIKDILIKNKIYQLTIYHTHLVDYLKQHSFPAIVKKIISRPFMYARGLSDELKDQDWYFQDGVGDAGFT